MIQTSIVDLPYSTKRTSNMIWSRYNMVDPERLVFPVYWGMHYAQVLALSPIPELGMRELLDVPAPYSVPG